MNIEKIARECGCTGLVITWSYPETRPITVPADADQRQEFTNAILEEAAKVCNSPSDKQAILKLKKVKTPYPMCSQPDKCAGHSTCQRDPNCID